MTLSIRLFLILFLGLALSLSLANRHELFVQPAYEEGDDAANALQIKRAKEGKEIYGNYSRWGFHHPGPAFFYVYAASEALLYDAWNVVSTPRNAHVLAGLWLQLLFLATALTLAARRLPHPWLGAGLLLGIAALHYHFVPGVLYSVWPPDVLLMPFLAFVVAAAAVGAGQRGALIPLALAGCFLVHGHIAQPLFVGPLTLLAVALGWRTRPPDERRWGRPEKAALAIIALFLLPLALDLLRGRESNAFAIWLHLQHQSGNHTTWLQSFLCYVSYGAYAPDPSVFNQLNDESFRPFIQRWPALLAWGSALALSCVLAWQSRRSPTPVARLGRSLLLFWLVASGLTLVWGRIQDGGLTYFNSHFNHSIVYLLAVAAVTLLSAHGPAQPIRWINRLAPAAGLVLAVWLWPKSRDTGHRAMEIEAALPQLLAADPLPSAPKFLVFDHTDWYEAVTTARALQRRGIPFYVTPQWDIMFGADVVLTHQRSTLAPGSVSVWRFYQRDVVPGAHPLNSECDLVFPEPVALPGWPATLDFAQSGHQPYVTLGIGESEEAGAWTDGSIAALEFVANPVREDVEIALTAAGFVTKRTRQGQTLRLRVNEVVVATALMADKQTLRVRVPAELWNRHASVRLVLELPDALSPASLGLSSDRRRLGLYLERCELGPWPAAQDSGEFGDR